MQSHSITPLPGVFDLPTGYHGTCWIDLSEGIGFDRSVPGPLKTFVEEVVRIVHENNMDDCRVGCAYMRVIDGASPENYMCWHIDNQDGGVRFSTALATDDARVNLAWPSDPTMVGRKVTETDWQQVRQPDNGVVAVFTTEPHGVLPQPPRPGERTAVFFATLYPDRESADLYTTNNTTTSTHAALPALEASR